MSEPEREGHAAAAVLVSRWLVHLTAVGPDARALLDGGAS